MAKGLDGVKKLSPEEVKKYRKIVLSYIGEKDSPPTSEPKDFSQRVASSKKVDGLNLSRSRGFKIQEKKPLKNRSENTQSDQAAVSDGQEKKEEFLPAPAEKKARDEESLRFRRAVDRQKEERKRIKEEERRYRIEKERAEQEKRNEAERLKQEEIRRTELSKLAREQAERDGREKEEKIKRERIKQAETERRERELAEKKRRDLKEAMRREALKKIEIVREAKRQTEERRRAEEAGKRQEKIRLAERQREETRRIKENLLLEKIKRSEEIKRIKREVELARQAAWEKKKIKLRKIWRKFKKDFSLKAEDFSSLIKRNIIYAALFTALFLAIAYAIFCLVVLRFDSNNYIVGRVLGYLPAPAVISNRGIISYNDFRKIENKDYLTLDLVQKKDYLARWVILANLSRKYGIPVQSADASAANLAVKFVLDKDFNRVGLSRINKISEAKAQSEISELGKYADEYNNGIYFSADQARGKFGAEILELAIGQTSGIIARADGYYLAERINDKNNQLGLKYLFVRALTLEQHVNKEAKKVAVFILVN